MELVANILFDGDDYASEQESAKQLDYFLKSKWLGRSYPEVRGRYLWRNPLSPDREPRIDRIVFPSAAWIDSGWHHGPIGIEIKANAKQASKAISQVLDYQCAIFEIRPGFWIKPEWIFVFPLSKVLGPIASVMSQNRIGMAYISKYKPELVLKSDHLTVMPFYGDHAVNFSCGYKLGSR